MNSSKHSAKPRSTWTGFFATVAALLRAKGSGASSGARRLRLALVAGALAIGLLAAAAPAQASFGIKSLSVEAKNANGSVDNRAGTHPYSYTVSFAMNTDAEGRPEGNLSNFTLDLPAGMTGNPLALPRCPGAQFEGGASGPHCPGSTQIGVAQVQLFGVVKPALVPVYNLVPRPGVVAQIGLSAANINSFLDASLRPGDYGLRLSDITIPSDKEIVFVTTTIWGVPMEASHDAERFCPEPGSLTIHQGCKSEVSPEAFLSLPTSCGAPLKTTLTLESLQQPGVPVPRTVESLGEGGAPEGIIACDRPAFDPSVSSRPETQAADSPSGLDFALHIPQAKLPQVIQGISGDPEGTATASAQLRDATVSLPAGLAVNPSSGAGLAACSLAQIDLESIQPPSCPAASAVGSVEARSPAVDHPLPGTVYLAQQGDNPFGSLLAIYIVVDDPATGLVVKLPGKVEPDPATGQLRTVVRDNPQQPIEDIRLHLNGGPRATLTTPPTCGTYTTNTELVPWTSPEGPTAQRTDSFQITQGAGGGACAGSEAALPNSPSFEAGTATPLAGEYSPLIFKVSRDNGSQKISSIDATLPPGLVSKLAGLTECSDAQIAQAAARSNPGEGATERDHPSCPSSSQFGTATVGAGSGSPLYVTGNAYLAGPYKGAPLSLAFITPAIAGPFDLGTVVVRAPAFINSSTAQITVKSDAIPTILHGIPLDVRSIAVNASRNEFTLNPTNCEPMSIGGQAISTLGGAASLSSRFQVGGCKGLDYEPKVYLRLYGKTNRGAFPKLRGIFQAKPGEANTKRLAVTLPKSEFIEQGHFRTICTRVQFAAGGGNGEKCPKGAVYGHAKVYTPILDDPLSGPVYLRSSNHNLPDMVMALHGPPSLPIQFELDARIDSKHGGVRSIFQAVPDVPVKKAILWMQGGQKGLFVNSRNICAQHYRATAKMTGQNNKKFTFNPVLSNSKCGKQHKKKNKRHHKRARR